MRSKIIARVKIVLAAFLLWGLGIVITLSGFAPVLGTYLRASGLGSRKFGVMLTSNDRGNIYYLDFGWLLHRRLTSSEVGPTTPGVCSAKQARERTGYNRLPTNASLGDRDSEFLELVGREEPKPYQMDLARLYSLVDGFDTPVQISPLYFIDTNGCSNKPLGRESRNETHLLEMRLPFAWKPSNKSIIWDNKVVYQIDADSLRQQLCVDGTSKWSLKVSDHEWCTNLDMAPGHASGVQYLEPADQHTSVWLNVTGTAYPGPDKIAYPCNKKPKLLHKRSSYYEHQSMSIDNSVTTFLVESGPTQTAGILLSRSPPEPIGLSPERMSITMLYLTYAYTGEPSVLGSSILLDHDTSKPLAAPGGAHFITVWDQPRAEAKGTKIRHIAYITSCSQSSKSLVIGQLIEGPIMELGSTDRDIYSPRSYRVKVLRQFPLTSFCDDTESGYDCQINCRRVLDFSILISHPDIDEPIWRPTNDTFYILAVTVCRSGLRFDRVQLPFIWPEVPRHQVPSAPVAMRFVSVGSIATSFRLKFDNFNMPGEKAQPLAALWNSQLKQDNLLSENQAQQPYRQYCAYAQRSMLWSLNISGFMDKRACLRRWHAHKLITPYTLQPLSKDSVLYSVRNVGVYLFNSTCSYCSPKKHPILKLPRRAHLLLSRFDGITGDASSYSVSPTQLAPDLRSTELVYYWDASVNSLRWIRVRGRNESDWDVIHKPATLWVPKFRPDTAPLSMTWTPSYTGEGNIVLGGMFGRSVMGIIDTNETNCELTFTEIGQARSPIGTVFAAPRQDLFAWSEPIREAAFMARMSEVLAGTLQGPPHDGWRRLVSVDGKVFTSIAYSDNKRQMYLAAPEEGSIYSIKLNQDTYNVIFAAADKTEPGNILKALRPHKLFVDPTSDAIYFATLLTINLTAFYDPSQDDIATLDTEYYTEGPFGWRRAPMRIISEDGLGWAHLTNSTFSAVEKLQRQGATDLSNSLWILRPDFSGKTLTSQPEPYYTNPDAIVLSLSGHDRWLVLLEYRISTIENGHYMRVIRLPVSPYSPDIFQTSPPLSPDDAEVLLDWSVLSADNILSPLGVSDFFSHGTIEKVQSVNRSAFGWLAFGCLTLHLCVAIGYNLNVWRRDFMTQRNQAL